MGILTPREDGYVQDLTGQLITLIEVATRNLQPAELSVTSGQEDTISHYRRLLADDGHVVMNWEPYPPEQIVRPLGVADPEVGVVKVVAAGDPGDPAKPGRVLALLFNHTGHPNVLSGDNYLLSADYPGLAARLLEEEMGGVALFFNGALGSVDIDGLRDRDWEGLDRTGRALARSVGEAAAYRHPFRLARDPRRLHDVHASRPPDHGRGMALGAGCSRGDGRPGRSRCRRRWR